MATIPSWAMAVRHIRGAAPDPLVSDPLWIRSFWLVRVPIATAPSW